MKKTLKQLLVEYLAEIGGAVASGELQRHPFPKYAYGTKRGYHTPRSVVRRLQELVNEGQISVEHRSNHSWYSSSAAKPKTQTVTMIEVDGKLVAQLSYS